ncbi:phage head-tail joining protein [bacterium BMS3Bbin10]|nr:phage head-tail joining protein [bacterium BMS3Bbin10]
MNGQAIGALRHRLTLEQTSLTPDGGGGNTESWVQVAQVWGRIAPLSGRESVEAARIAGRYRYEITIRYRAGVEPAMRFRLGARIFHILAIEDIGERGKWLKALCEEREL